MDQLVLDLTVPMMHSVLTLLRQMLKGVGLDREVRPLGHGASQTFQFYLKLLVSHKSLLLRKNS